MIDKTKSNLNIKKHKRDSSKKRNINYSRRKKDEQKLKNVNIIFGMDNGSTGTLCCLVKEDKDYINFIETPSFQELDYTQELQTINRIDLKKIKDWIENNINNVKKIINNDNIKCVAILQRPMVNPQRFKQSLHAIRAFEATLILLEMCNIEYIIIDSKKWQHYFFGKNTTQIDLKFESMKLGLNIINDIKQNEKEKELMLNCIKKHGDADGLLISKYGMEKLIKD